MFGVPPQSDFDLRFRLLGIPVRVTPWFGLIALIMGWRDGDDQALRNAIIWALCVFLSVLVHEFGHGLMARAFGDSPSIVLHGMGGLCFTDPNVKPWKRLLILFAGPGAGFLLCAAVFLGWIASGRLLHDPITNEAVNDLIYINLVWGLVNLLPLWFLDGGQILGVLLSWISPRSGMRWTHVISLLSAGALATAAFVYTQSVFLTIFFAYFALINYQTLQALHQQYAAFGGGDDNADWWKR